MSLMALILSIDNKRWGDVLGMNARNAYVETENPLEAVRLVNNKHETKKALRRAGVPVAPTLRLIRDRGDLARLAWEDLPDRWALKPNLGSQGAGIMLAAGRDGADRWRTASGRPLDRKTVGEHLRRMLEGEFSYESVERDWGLFEPLIIPHPDLAALIPSGLPDIRIICRSDEPLLAMMRLPTEASEGRANLHQGAIGASVDLETGRVTRARLGQEQVWEHPDTGARLVGARVPHWERIVEAATRCAAATGLGYLGADVVVDKDRGPLVLEVNARPGLEIQNVAGTGLRSLIGGAASARTKGFANDQASLREQRPAA